MQFGGGAEDIHGLYSCTTHEYRRRQRRNAPISKVLNNNKLKDHEKETRLFAGKQY